MGWCQVLALNVFQATSPAIPVSAHAKRMKVEVIFMPLERCMLDFCSIQPTRVKGRGQPSTDVPTQ